MVTDPKSAVKARYPLSRCASVITLIQERRASRACRMDLTTAASADPLATKGALDARRMDLTTAAPRSSATDADCLAWERSARCAPNGPDHSRRYRPSPRKERPMRAEWT